MSNKAPLPGVSLIVTGADGVESMFQASDVYATTGGQLLSVVNRALLCYQQEVQGEGDRLRLVMTSSKLWDTLRAAFAGFNFRDKTEIIDVTVSDVVINADGSATVHLALGNLRSEQTVQLTSQDVVSSLDALKEMEAQQDDPEPFHVAFARLLNRYGWDSRLNETDEHLARVLTQHLELFESAHNVHGSQFVALPPQSGGDQTDYVALAAQNVISKPYATTDLRTPFDEPCTHPMVEKESCVSCGAEVLNVD